MSVMDTQPFGELTPSARMKQWISFAIIVGNQRIATKMERIKQITTAHPANMPTLAQVEYDALWEQIALITLHNELLKIIASDIH